MHELLLGHADTDVQVGELAENRGERRATHGERKTGQLAMLVGVLASAEVAGARAWCVAELGRGRHREAAQVWRERQLQKQETECSWHVILGAYGEPGACKAGAWGAGLQTACCMRAW